MKTSQTWFITGTDTGAGKTSLARALLLAARARGIRAIGYKPVESGCAPDQDFGEDALALAKAAQSAPQSSFVFPAPIAPSLAAAAAGKTVSLSAIRARAAELSKEAEILIIEGAGGLLVPLTPDATIADLAKTLGHQILIVAPDCLGAINHSLLTIEVARTRGLRVAALVLSERDEGAGQGLDNQAQLRQWGHLPVHKLAHATSDEELASAGEVVLSALLANAEAGK